MSKEARDFFWETQSGIVNSMDNVEKPFGIEIVDITKSGYVSTPENLYKLEKEAKLDPLLTVRFWAERLKPTVEEMGGFLKHKTKVFKESKINDDDSEVKEVDPEENLKFWMENALVNRRNLEAVVVDETDRNGFSVSSEKAREYARLKYKREATQDQKLSAAMLTLAKLEAVTPIMDDVYPNLTPKALEETKKALAVLTRELSAGTKIDLGDKESVSKVFKKAKLSPAVSAVVIIQMMISACSNPSTGTQNPEVTYTPSSTPTETFTATPMATETPAPTATEVIPTEVPISFDIPRTLDNKLDFEKIVNVIPDDQAEKEVYFARVKAELLKRQDEANPNWREDGANIPTCVEDIYNLGWEPATEVGFSCSIYGESMMPGLLSRDSEGYVVATFLINLHDKDDFTKFTQSRLLNVVLYPDEIAAIYKKNGYEVPDFQGAPWGHVDTIGITIFQGDFPYGYQFGKYPKMEKLIRENQEAGITQDTFKSRAQFSDNDLLIDSYVFAAMCVYAADAFK